MRVLVDENLPPAIARALAALFAGEHEVVHIRDRFGPGVTDTEWITQLNREGRWVVIQAIVASPATRLSMQRSAILR